jgi:hypothetical protein
VEACAIGEVDVRGVRNNAYFNAIVLM